MLPRGAIVGLAISVERQRGPCVVGTELRRGVLAGDQRQPEHALVEVDAARQIADAELDRADLQCRVDHSHRVPG